MTGEYSGSGETTAKNNKKGLLGKIKKIAGKVFVKNTMLGSNYGGLHKYRLGDRALYRVWGWDVPESLEGYVDRDKGTVEVEIVAVHIDAVLEIPYYTIELPNKMCKQTSWDKLVPLSEYNTLPVVSTDHSNDEHDLSAATSSNAVITSRQQHREQRSSSQGRNSSGRRGGRKSRSSSGGRRNRERSPSNSSRKSDHGVGVHTSNVVQYHHRRRPQSPNPIQQESGEPSCNHLTMSAKQLLESPQPNDAAARRAPSLPANAKPRDPSPPSSIPPASPWIYKRDSITPNAHSSPRRPSSRSGRQPRHHTKHSTNNVATGAPSSISMAVPAHSLSMDDINGRRNSANACTDEEAKLVSCLF